MPPRATVLVPTHDHGPLLIHSVESAIRQTVNDIEILIVGDGASSETREAALSLQEQDERIRFFDNPKGPNRGEIHRHAALREASGRMVCYLCDDDLWLPDHIEVMETLLADADFAHTLPFHISTDGSLFAYNGDLSVPYFRRVILEGRNFIPYSCGGHTLDIYHRTEGWQTSPPGAYTDLTMWQRLLRAPGCRAVSGTHPTLLHFPTFERSDWPMQRRLEEVLEWKARMSSRDWQQTLTARLLDTVARARAMLENEMDFRVRPLELRVEGLEWDLASVRGTRTWRLRQRLLRTPLVGAALRRAASARSEPRAR